MEMLAQPLVRHVTKYLSRFVSEVLLGIILSLSNHERQDLPACLSQAASVVGGNPSVNTDWQSFFFLHRQSHLRKVLVLQTPEVFLLVVGE